MMYSISVIYETGNSFGSELLTEEVGAVWESLTEAKEALQMIKEHYEVYQKTNDCGISVRPSRWEDYALKPWFSDEYSEFTIMVKVEGKPHKLHCFWIGYFESLISASVELSE